MISKAAIGETKLRKEIHGYTQPSIGKTVVGEILLYLQNQTEDAKWRRTHLAICCIPTYEAVGNRYIIVYHPLAGG
jgi:hypothetical protein